MKIWCFLTLSLLFSQVAYGDINTKMLLGRSEEQKIVIPMDAKEQNNWVFSFYQLGPNHGSVYEWVPVGESVDSWNKLIQIQFLPFSGEKFSAKDFAAVFQDKLKEAVPEAQSTITPLSDDTVLFEWSVPDNSKQASAQNEIFQLFSTPEGIYRVAYTEKVATMNPDVKKAWVQRLADIKLGQGQVQAIE